MSMCVVIILSLAGTVFAAPQVITSQRIVGGSHSVIQEYPYIASLQILDYGISWNHVCGGSLITPRTILSAAHCLYHNNLPRIWRVRLGSSFRSSGGQVHQVTQFILHENYNDVTLTNNVAIVTMATSAILSNTVQIARIPPSGYSIPDNQQVTAIGWGRLNEEGFSPEQLQQVDINVINQQICADRYTYLSTIRYWPYMVDEGMLCSGILDVGGKDACQGDAGGPVSLKTAEGHVVVGITSWAFGCAHESYPGVNVRTSYYSDWIVRHGSVVM